jgi:hypothetical protein
MGGALKKLASLGTAPLIANGSQSDMGQVPEILRHLYQQANGFYAFESALHVLPVGRKAGVIDLATWNAEGLWRDSYEDLVAPDWTFFAEDVFGVQFVVTEGGISTFDPETGDLERQAADAEEWAAAIIADYDFLTGHSVASKWQSLYGPLPLGSRLMPKIPFVLKGEMTVPNLYVLDAVKGMRARGDFARQIRNLPEGAQVTLRVVD